MKKNIILACFCLLYMAGYGQNKGPKIEFKELTHDYGEILVDSGPATCEFIFSNTGDEPLIVSDAKASCGCTVPKWTKEPILPGEKGSISVTYNSTKIASSAPFQKSITITSNSDPNKVVLSIKGKVVAELSELSQGIIDNNIVDIGNFKNGTIIEKTVVITNVGNANLTIIGFNSNFEQITVEFPTAPIAPNDQVQLKVKIDTEKIVEKHASLVANVNIVTDSPKTPNINFQIKGVRK